jgi:hypothetical protein
MMGLHPCDELAGLRQQLADRGLQPLCIFEQGIERDLVAVIGFVVVGLCIDRPNSLWHGLVLSVKGGQDRILPTRWL